ncbi:hypothetical protein AAFF_G00432450 [Aldrovandia affinis]|uniref:Uncharacterized protein n=1 Tax=Aldrovandia affinis TaxID=143900 RepID=A0AAD7S8J6_9TELE|nr:hypothetical protein AAFF_G00432450 [Aldrovandia affinis]
MHTLPAEFGKSGRGFGAGAGARETEGTAATVLVRYGFMRSPEEQDKPADEWILTGESWLSLVPTVSISVAVFCTRVKVKPCQQDGVLCVLLGLQDCDEYGFVAAQRQRLIEAVGPHRRPGSAPRRHNAVTVTPLLPAGRAQEEQLAGPVRIPPYLTKKSGRGGGNKQTESLRKQNTERSVLLRN